MKEDVLKFRKLCDILIKEKDYTVNKIVLESGINWPTIKKLREEPINELRIAASNLGKVQDYLHKHCETIRLAGIKCAEIPETFTDKSEKAFGHKFLKSQEDVIMAGQRDLCPVKESESIKLVVSKVHEKMKKEILGKRKYTKKEKPDKESVTENSEKIVSETMTAKDLLGRQPTNDRMFWTAIGLAQTLLPKGVSITVIIGQS